jgi:hypothetical protein
MLTSITFVDHSKKTINLTAIFNLAFSNFFEAEVSSSARSFLVQKMPFVSKNIISIIPLSSRFYHQLHGRFFFASNSNPQTNNQPVCPFFVKTSFSIILVFLSLEILITWPFSKLLFISAGLQFSPLRRIVLGYRNRKIRQLNRTSWHAPSANNGFTSI